MYTENDFRAYELYHHGILGMKWGKKQGPPYPLDASDHSAAEKKAGYKDSIGLKKKGSRNEERYARKEAKSYKKQMNNQVREIASAKMLKSMHEKDLQNWEKRTGWYAGIVKKNSQKGLSDADNYISSGEKELDRLLKEAGEKGYDIDVKQGRTSFQIGTTLFTVPAPEFDVKKKNNNYPDGVKFEVSYDGKERATSSKIEAAGKELASKAQDVDKKFTDLTKQYEKEFTNLKNNKEFKESIIKQIKNDWVLNDDDDEEEKYLVAQMAVEDSIDKYYSKDLKAMTKSFHDSIDNYYNFAQKTTNDLVKDFGDVSVKDAARYETAIGNTLVDLGNAQWVRYLNNHEEIASDNPIYDEIIDEIAKSSFK